MSHLSLHNVASRDWPQIPKLGSKCPLQPNYDLTSPDHLIPILGRPMLEVYTEKARTVPSSQQLQLCLFQGIP